MATNEAEDATRGGLKCTCVLECVNDYGQVIQKRTFKSAVLDLGRNEVNDVVLKLSHSEGSFGPYTVREHSIHKRFVKDGKATIILKSQKTQFLISNCPPYHLRVFLQCLAVKLAARGKTQGSHRRMLGDISLKFNEISPLNDSDITKARKNARRDDVGKRSGDSNNKENALQTPSRNKGRESMAKKRKLSEIGCSSHQSNPPKKKTISCQLVHHHHGQTLSAEQTTILELVKKGESVFFTGSAGTGKSYLLRRLLSSLPPETTFATASTGTAACLIGGTTLHAFAGIGTGGESLEKSINMASRDQYASTWRKCHCLVIDEISMVDADLFDKLEAVARAVRKNQQVFGGIQLVMCGDFFQLPPVSKDGNRKKHCFLARSWHSSITRSVELTQIYRQDDKRFITLLQNIRIGRCPPAITALLTATQNQDIERDGIRATRLFTHKGDVEATNRSELEALDGEERQFVCEDSDSQFSRTLDLMCPVGRCVRLKIGAQVMLTKNIGIHRNLVNGARGVVKSFDSSQGYPVVQFASGTEEVIGPEKWSVRSVGGGAAVVTRKQLPLKLAWAISIHKSQGMTLDCVEIALGRCFEAGQAYVALSRAKNLQSLRVRDFDPSCVRAHPDVIEFYRNLRRMRRNYIE